MGEVVSSSKDSHTPNNNIRNPINTIHSQTEKIMGYRDTVHTDMTSNDNFRRHLDTCKAKADKLTTIEFITDNDFLNNKAPVLAQFYVWTATSQKLPKNKFMAKFPFINNAVNIAVQKLNIGEESWFECSDDYWRKHESIKRESSEKLQGKNSSGGNSS